MIDTSNGCKHGHTVPCTECGREAYIAALLSAKEQAERERDELKGVLVHHGFVTCDIPACNCNSWHHRFGLRQRMDEIKEALEDAEVLNNDTGNLPLRAVKKLAAERGALKALCRDLEGAAVKAISAGICDMDIAADLSDCARRARSVL